MSGGMRQRIMIAIALSCRPKLLIADEPTTALDVTIQSQILDLITELKEELGISVLFITHNLGVVAETARRVVVMYAGKVMEKSKVRDLFHQPLHPYTQGLLNSYRHGINPGNNRNESDCRRFREWFLIRSTSERLSILSTVPKEEDPLRKAGPSAGNQRGRSFCPMLGYLKARISFKGDHSVNGRNAAEG